MITTLGNRFNFAKILLASTFLFSTLSSITKAGEEYAKALEAQANSKPMLNCYVPLHSTVIFSANRIGND